jgi:hypothetical protein
VVQSANVYSGHYAAFVGNDSGVGTAGWFNLLGSVITNVPANTQLSFWVYRKSSGGDVMNLRIRDENNTPSADAISPWPIPRAAYNDTDWVNYIVDLSSVAGGNIYVYVEVLDNGAHHTYMLLDDVQLIPDPTAAEMLTFSYGANAGTISGTDIALTVPYSTDVTTLVPTYTTSWGATGSPVSGTPRNFTTPQTYTVASQDTSVANGYTVTVSKAPASTEKAISSVFFPGLGYAFPTNEYGTNLVLVVRSETVVTALAPTYSVSPYASGSPSPGTSGNFTTPQTCTVTAADGSKAHFFVKTRTEGAYVDAVLTCRAAAYWPLYEPSGAVAADLSILGHPGTYDPANSLGLAGPNLDDGFSGFAGTPPWAVGLAGNAAPSPVVVPALHLSGTNITIMCWFNPDYMPQPDRAGLFSGNGGTPATQTALRFTTGGAGMGLVWNNGYPNANLNNAANFPVAANQWSFGAASVTPTNATLYLGTTNAGLQSLSFPGSYVSQPFMGVNMIGNDRSVGGRYFQGRVAHVAVFDYALTPAQIGQLFAAAAPPATVTLQITQPDASGNFTIGGVAGAGQSVSLWKSTDLSLGAAGWTQVDSTTADDAGAFRFNVSTGADPKAFYKVQ